MQHAERGHGGADVDDRHGQSLLGRGKLRGEQTEGSLQRVGFDIDHASRQPGEPQRRLADLDVLLSTSRQQHFDPFGAAGEAPTTSKSIATSSSG